MRTLLVMLTTSLATSSAIAQTSPTIAWPVDSGSRVRIVAVGIGDRARVGTLVSTSPDTLVVNERKSTAFTVAAPDVVRLEVSRGTRTYRAKGTLIGLLAGAAGGALLGTATYSPAKCTTGEWCLDMGQEFAAAGGAVLGAIVGTLVGYSIGASPRDIWEAVPLPSR
ncbi:MAG TPA: hypothetical protein VJ840_16160 [Gemmatimonadaceae bacterium]|nr:hypothetical protein [Gemmatimonadaceae bacterium]